MIKHLNTLQSMIDEERSSGVSNPNIIRDANGRIIEATAALRILGTPDTSGIDPKLGYRYDFD
ncbi:hypothetical protein P4S64_22925 [Vibrio sp. M60_M31a]